MNEIEIWAKGDMRIVAHYDHNFSVRDDWVWENDEEIKEVEDRINEHGVYYLRLEKWFPEVNCGWDCIDGLGGNIPSDTQSLMDIAKEQFNESWLEPDDYEKFKELLNE